MRKIKQLANNAFVRSDKTEVLSEGLLEADKQIEQIRISCETTVKKLHACLQGQVKEKDRDKDKDGYEKRIKKVPQWVMGNSMTQTGPNLGEGSVLGEVLSETGRIEMKLGMELIQFEGKVEESILKPMQTLLEVDIPNIYKLRRHLNKYTNDMDTAKGKLQQAIHSTSRHSVSSGQGGKIDNFKEEFEDAQVKVEQCRDNLAAEMYSLIARESEIAGLLLTFLNFQKEYHQQALLTLNELISGVESMMCKSTHKPVYGVHLVEHLTTTGRSIAYPIELCICGLLETAIDEEGLFRMAGSNSKVKKLKSAFDAGLMDLQSLLGEFSDAHVIATALKSYFRELPEPLLTFALYTDWMNAIRLGDSDERLKAIWTVVQKLPKSNFENLQYLVKFLKELSKHHLQNKMSPANIAIVIAPNLLWENVGSGAGGEGMCGDSQMGLNMTMTHHITSLLDQLITHSDYFFPQEIEFFITFEKPKEVEKPHISSNGNVATGEDSSAEEQNSPMKRSHSNSSVDEHGNAAGSSPPHGSPKPVIRRKNKPAPVPPIAPVIKNPMAHFSANANSPSSPRSPAPTTGNETAVQRSSSSSSRYPGGKPVSGAPTPFSQSYETAGKKSNEKREAMWIPPSPRETVRKNVAPTEAVLSGSGGTMGPPAKPPPPALAYQSGVESSTTVPKTVPTSELPSQKPTLPASPLRHKSSFKSSNSVENTLGGSGPVKNNTTDNIGSSSTNCSSPSAFSSLPRHFHTENSYKNARPARPPSMWGVPPPAPPVVPPQTPVNSTTSQATQPDISLPSSEKGGSEGTIGTEKQRPASLQIGFERVEATVRKDSLPTVAPIPESVNEPGEIGEGKTTLPLGVDRPIPAPRSSLLAQSNSSVSTSSAPVVRERPSLMAKPRDLSKRNVHGGGQGLSGVDRSPSTVTSGATFPNSKGSEDPLNSKISEYEKRHSRSSSAGGHSDTDLSCQDVTKDTENRESGEKGPESPPGKGKPPRPQPPAPPKVRVSQAESTDL